MQGTAKKTEWQTGGFHWGPWQTNCRTDSWPCYIPPTSRCPLFHRPHRNQGSPVFLEHADPCWALAPKFFSIFSNHNLFSFKQKISNHVFFLPLFHKSVVHFQLMKERSFFIEERKLKNREGGIELENLHFAIPDEKLNAKTIKWKVVGELDVLKASKWLPTDFPVANGEPCLGSGDIQPSLP